MLDQPPSRRTPRASARELGARGEDLAAAHLERRGLTVIARNVRTRWGEIDLIALEPAALVFVEVKTRTATDRSRPGPLESVGPRQRANVRRLAAAWLAEQRPAGLRARDIRFDAIGVTLDRSGALVRLEHVESAW